MRPWLLLGMGLLAGCGASASLQSLHDRFASEAARAAAARAPDMHAAAERARHDALDAHGEGDAAAALDHATRARLLLAAAVAESERLAAEQRRLAVEAEERAAQRALAHDEHAREEIARQLRRHHAARVASEQASRAFEVAVQDEQRRAARRGRDNAALWREAAAALVARARLLLAAAQALGAEASDIGRVEQRIARAAAIRSGAQAVTAAETAVHHAWILLGRVRARQPGPTRDEQTSLAEAASEAGFSVERRADGLAVLDSSLFTGSSTRLRAQARTRMRRLGALVQAHPHGPVHLRAYGPRASIARDRAAAVYSSLVEANVNAERLIVDSTTDRTSALVELRFVAYGPPAP